MSKSRLDEYIKRRQNGSAVYNPRKIQYGQGGGYNPPAPQRAQTPANQGGQVPVYRPNQWSRPAMVKAPTATQPTGTELDATKPTDSAGSNVLTWDDQIDLEIQAAAKKVLEVSNRKFQYNASESPIYSIMRQEYLKEADLAAGRATAAAAQNAGGFGSSFAVMAGEEARRQVMEGFHDQEDELYAAAQSEFEAERASAFDNYLKLRELKAMEQERLETDAPATMTLPDGTTVEVTDAARELYAGYLDSFTQGTGYDTLKTAMINGGASEADADQAIAMFKRLGGATVADQISALEASPTLSGAAEAYVAAKQNGTLDKDAAKISAGAKAAVEASLKNAGDNEEAMNTALAEAAQAVKDGYMSESDYVSIITADIHADIKDMESGDEKISDRKKRKRVLDSIEGIIQDHEEGNLSDSGYQMALLEMVPYLKQYFPQPEHIGLQSQYANQYQFSFNLNAKQREVIRAVLEAYEKDKVSKG